MYITIFSYCRECYNEIRRYSTVKELAQGIFRNKLFHHLDGGLGHVKNSK